MSDHEEEMDNGNVFAVALVIATCVFVPAMYGLISGVFS